MNTQVEEKYTHKHLQKCIWAHNAISWHPEKKGEQVCRGFEAAQNELKELGADERALEKLESLFLAWISAKSNCLSSAITGPARFPVARAEKANRRENDKHEEYYGYYKKVKAAIEKEKYYKKHPEARLIMSDDSDAIERLNLKLKKCEELQEKMKLANKYIRKKDTENLKLLLGELNAAKIMQPDYMGRIGFAQFELSNNNAEIRRIKQRIAELETIQDRKTEVFEIDNETSMTIDTEQGRIYIEFPGKPDDKTRNLVKSYGFKWTPSKGHWGRKLTRNAEYSAKLLLKELKAA